ncbi:MAG: LysR family transcriptional regulator [SAR324 cluster bacterium]|nr:LysR family transcriptional regulator [SAR324 cluster bacterium]
MHIRNIDLNLFVVFDAIYSEGNVTRAADILHLTQPAVSHALARLRTLFDDPLFVRVGNNMAPTPLAKNLIHSIRGSLKNLQTTLSQPNRFNPADARKLFVLGMRTVMEAIALPKLMNIIELQAPGVDLVSCRISRRDLERELMSGTLDLALDVLIPVGAEIQCCPLAQSRLAILARPEHPFFLTPTLETYLEHRHVLVSSRKSGPGLEDFELSRLGHKRRIGLRAQNYLAGAMVVAETAMLMTVPEFYANFITSRFPLKQWPFPVEAARLEIAMYWHSAAEFDPANRWMREQLVAIMGEPHELISSTIETVPTSLQA